jgi:hypothetical protein
MKRESRWCSPECGISAIDAPSFRRWTATTRRLLAGRNGNANLIAGRR